MAEQTCEQCARKFDATEQAFSDNNGMCQACYDTWNAAMDAENTAYEEALEAQEDWNCEL